ncbi:unnamed protein product, partial [marine sediment metagenome]
MYHIPIKSKKFKTTNNRIKEIAEIMKISISKPIRNNSNPLIVGISVINTERRILL